MTLRAFVTEMVLYGPCSGSMYHYINTGFQLKLYSLNTDELEQNPS